MLDQLPAWLTAGAAPGMAREIRAARKARGWTLSELSAAVHLDKGYLSKIERGLKAPSVATVLNLARALDVPVAQLFGEALDDSAIHISRADTRTSPSDRRAGSGYRLEALTAGKGGAGLEGFLVHPPPAFSEEFRAEHDGEELLFVVAGEVEVKFADRVIALSRGDALQFPGRLQHQVRRTSADACILIAVTRA